jgi:hypothetical protein
MKIMNKNCCVISTLLFLALYYGTVFADTVSIDLHCSKTNKNFNEIMDILSDSSINKSIKSCQHLMLKSFDISLVLDSSVQICSCIDKSHYIGTINDNLLDGYYSIDKSICSNKAKIAMNTALTAISEIRECM